MTSANGGILRVGGKNILRQRRGINDVKASVFIMVVLRHAAADALSDEAKGLLIMSIFYLFIHKQSGVRHSCSFTITSGKINLGVCFTIWIFIR